MSKIVSYKVVNGMCVIFPPYVGAKSDFALKIKYDYDTDIKNIKLKSIEYNNMFIYLDGNHIDFEKFYNIFHSNHFALNILIIHLQYQYNYFDYI
jgi:hypothetical protein